jgi:hypothetical protein
MQRRRNSRPSRQCRGCPFWAPPARCLDPSIRSGWCGDWIWYMRYGKPCRRRYASPKDPRTAAQLLSRARFTRASRRYSRFLTEEQRAACIAAGAKVWSRPRLGQSGSLTGQQYWMHKDGARVNASVKSKNTGIAIQVPRPQHVTRSTSGLHLGATVLSPEQRRLKARAASGALQNQRAAGSARMRRLRPVGLTPLRAGRRAGRSLLLRGLRARRRSWGVRTSHRARGLH